MVNPTIPKEMVKITKQPLNQEKVIVNKSTKNIVTADKDATDKTKELISYLREIAKQDKFIFGHQNDVINSVQPNMLIKMLVMNYQHLIIHQKKFLVYKET